MNWMYFVKAAKSIVNLLENIKADLLKLGRSTNNTRWYSEGKIHINVSYNGRFIFFGNALFLFFVYFYFFLEIFTF